MLRVSPLTRQGLPRCSLTLSPPVMTQLAARRRVHTSEPRRHPPTPTKPALSGVSLGAPATPPPDETPVAPSALSILPLSSVLRSLMTTIVSSSPVLLSPSMAIMTLLAHSRSALLNPDRNALLKYFLKKTFYAQFCAGETPAEVQRTIQSLKDIGFSGVFLCYAKEVVMTADDKKNLAAAAARDPANNLAEVQAWGASTLDTVRLTSKGDFVALKFSGAGVETLHRLSERREPQPAMAEALDQICQLAVERGVRLLFDAEQVAVQAGIDDWTLTYMRKYNTTADASGEKKAVVYGTYQAYLKALPDVIAEHLRIARDEGFALGVKLVRGAYLGSDPRHLIHDTKADTDKCYDAVAEAVLRRAWRAPVTGSGAFPACELVIASHNEASAQKARAILAAGEAKTTDVAFGQLQGMADEVSCQLVLDGRSAPVRTYKYLVWGSTGECMKYLLRRAHENRDAVQRTKSSRDAMWDELVRRTKATVGL